jgi:hypothetical protein
LANATLGVVSSASLAVNTIGQGLALARGRLPKHAIKQVDRMLSNPGIDVDELSKRWVAHAVGSRRTAAEPPRGGGSDDGTGLALRGWSEDSDYDLSTGKDPVDDRGGAIDQYGSYHPPGSTMAFAYRLARAAERKT